MIRTDFNKGWNCRCLTTDGEPYPVSIPHDAMISEPRVADSVGEGNIGFFAGFDYEYTKTFFVPAEQEQQKTLFEFEGVYHNAEVYINGEKAAERPYGYSNFYADATALLKYGEDNEIRVLARNSDQPNSRWYSGTGIYRPVWMFTGPEAHIPVNGLRIRTRDYEKRRVEVTVATSLPGKVRLEIYEGTPSGRAVNDTPEGLRKIAVYEKDSAEDTKGGVKWEEDSSRAVFLIDIPDGKLWSPEEPCLYTAKAFFGEDSTEDTFGIRTLSWGPRRGITINGERVILRGACIHHDNGILGACAFPEAEERRVRILMENGYNAIRSAHNPVSKTMLESCDRLGMLMMDEFVDCWYIHKTKYDYALLYEDWWKEDLRNMVYKDINHPCVIMYSTGNEVAETGEKRGIQLTENMTNWLHQLDKTRPVSCGINIFFNFLYSIGMGVYSDDKADKLAGAVGDDPDAAFAAAKDKALRQIAAARAEKEGKSSDFEETAKPKKKAVGSEFYNTLACLMGDRFMKFGATLYPCDLKTRDAYANMDIAGYNYGLWRYRHDLKKYPNRLILGSETFCKDAYDFWEIAKENPNIVGDFVWAGIDYIGETGIGAAEFKDYLLTEDQSHMTGGNGRIDLLGKPRAEAAFTRVALEREVGPNIAVLPVYENEKLQLTGWQFTKAVESWAWRGCEGMMAEVEVYARAAEVALYINDKCVGRKKIRKGCAVKFRVPYEDGEIRAVSYDQYGEEIAASSLRTAGEESILRLKPETETVKPEGLCFIPMQYTDEEGIWHPMGIHYLKVEVENGTLAGLGSANPYVKGNYTDDTVKTYFGEAMAVVRAGTEGAVTVKVTDTETGEYKEISVPIAN